MTSTLPEEAVKAAQNAIRTTNWEYGITDADMAKALTAALPFLPVQGAGVKPIDTAPKTGEEFLARCGTDWPWFSCFWDGSAFVHYDHDEGLVSYPATEWMPMPEARILSALEPSAARDLALEEARSSIERIIHHHFKGPNLIDADWDRPTILGLDNGWRRQVELAASDIVSKLSRALSSPDHADAGKVEGDGWMPIESAPKDGTYVLACRAHSILPLIIRFDEKYGEWESEQGDHVYNILGWRPLPTTPEAAK